MSFTYAQLYMVHGTSMYTSVYTRAEDVDHHQRFTLQNSLVLSLALSLKFLLICLYIKAYLLPFSLRYGLRLVRILESSLLLIWVYFQHFYCYTGLQTEP